LNISTNCQRGFSLAELLATMGIAALLLSVGLPGLASFAKNARQVSVANEMLGDFHYARDLAITNNARVTVCPSSDGATCDGAGWEDGRIVFIDTDGNLTLNGAETVQRVTGDVGDVDVNTAEFGASITYRPSGRAMANIVRNNTGEFSVCDDRGSSHARALIVDMSGRPRVSHEDSSGLPPTCP
jgi:type IV fimbrial biogenesis protein FimT